MSEAVKAQYRILHELKRIDEKVYRIQTDLVRIPEELTKLDQSLTSQRKLLESGKEALDAVEKKLRESERDLKDKEESLRKAESKMMEVKTNEEYQAAMKENQAQKGAKGALEDQAITVLTDVEAKRNQHNQAQQQFKEYEAKIQGEKKVLEDERNKLVNLLEQQLQVRSQSAVQLDRSVAAIYERLTTRAKGVAIVAVDKGMCVGCNMRVRPQLYNEILGFKQIHQCPACGKLLVPDMGESSPADSGDGTH